MLSTLRNSILMKLLLAMVLVVSMAFLSMLSSFITTEATQGAAAAINQAGTLRMQSYRIATRLVYQKDEDPLHRWERTRSLVNEFEQRLTNPRLTRFLPKDPKQKLQKAYDRVARKWQRTIKPLLNVYVSITAPPGLLPLPPEEIEKDPTVIASRNAIRSRYLDTVDRFVADIDKLVKALEEDAEYKIRRLRMIELVSLFLTITLVAITMLLMQQKILYPLRNLLKTAQRLRNGEFYARTRYHGEDELGRLGHAMNVMASDLSKLYGELEQRVEQKTRDLERSNRSLDLLYRSNNRLSKSEFNPQLFRSLLEDIQETIGVGPGTICLNTSSVEMPAERISSNGELVRQDLCSLEACQRCMGSGQTQLLLKGIPGQSAPVLSIPISDRGEQYGALLLQLPEEPQLERWQTTLLETLADNIGQAISTHRRLVEGRRLVLYEERAVIARELHDSLAQSLSYLKIQVSRLQMTLKQPDGSERAQPILTELRDGLSNAYRQLRELLTTFRLKMDERGLEQAIRSILEDFRQRCDIKVDFQYRLTTAFPMSPNEEIHVLQIIREALSNVMRHSGANHARILLENDGRRIRVVIDDDGIGLSGRQQRPNHYGMAIISERSERLGGQLEITSGAEGGTRIELTFQPGTQTNRTNTEAAPALPSEPES